MISREIVVIEDSLDEQRLTSSGIRKVEVPCHVTIWRDGESAIARLLDPAKRPPALIVLDYHLPKFSGLQVLMAVRGAPRTRFVPVVMMSIALTDAEIRECYEQRANCCMIKAVAPDTFVEDVALMVRHWMNVTSHAEPRPDQVDRACIPLPDLPLPFGG